MRTYGTLQHDPGQKKWLIRCEPHVMLRAKRVFGKVEAWARGGIALHDSPENARDLQWFLDRYPLEVKDLGYLTQRADAHRERETLVQRLLSSHQSPLGFEMIQPPREYQKVAATMALGTSSLLLADDVLRSVCSRISGRCRRWL